MPREEDGLTLLLAQQKLLLPKSMRICLPSLTARGGRVKSLADAPIKKAPNCMVG